MHEKLVHEFTGLTLSELRVINDLNHKKLDQNQKFVVVTPTNRFWYIDFNITVVLFFSGTT